MTTYKDAVGTNIGENVILGKTPTFSGWTVDPAGDVDRLTDGSLASAMTSGSFTLLGAWDYAFVDFDVPNGYYIIGGYGNLVCAAANAYIYIATSTGKNPYDAAIAEDEAFFNSDSVLVDDGVIRFGCTANGASTLTPNFFELWAVRIA